MFTWTTRIHNPTLTVVVPLIFRLITIKGLQPEDELFKNKTFFLAVTYSGTSVPVIHCLLNELKILNSELGRLGLSTALIGDIVSLLLMHISQWVKLGLEKGIEVVVDCGPAIVFVLVVVFVLRPLMKWAVRRTPEAGQIKDGYLPLFATTCGMRIDLSYLKKSNRFAIHQAIAAAVTLNCQIWGLSGAAFIMQDAHKGFFGTCFYTDNQSYR
ncbi:hypothetical protein CRYUN_Cryun33cG0023100 [Craigia yunnanensis]